MGFFDSSNTTTNESNTGTVSPNLSTGSVLGGGGVGSPVSVAYSPGGVQGQGAISASSGGIIDQSLNFNTSSYTNEQSYSSQTTPTVIVGSPGATVAPSNTTGVPSSSSVLGLTWQAWAFIAGGAAILLYFLRKH